MLRALLILLVAGAGCQSSSDTKGSGAVSSAKSANVEASLLSEQVAVEPGKPFYIALRMKIQNGWHTYWKNPGDAGMALRVVWTLPDGFVVGPIKWPAPERIPEKDLMTYGYEEEVLFPIEVAPPVQLANRSVTLTGKFEWLECRDICLPGSAVLSLSLPVRSGPPKPSPAARLIAEAKSLIPGPDTGWTFSAEAGPRAISLAFRPPPGVSPGEAYLFVDRPLVTEHAAPQGFEQTPGGYRLTLSPATNAGTLERLTGVLVVEDQAGAKSSTAVEVNVPVNSSGEPQ